MSGLQLLPYLLGLVPILLARSRQAHIVAILFGIVSIGLGVYFIWCIQHNADDNWTGVQAAVIGGLCVSAVSLTVTFYVDKKYNAKA